MSQSPRPPRPIAPTVIVVVGCLVGAVGLWALLVGTGVISPPLAQIAGIIALVLGFGVALVVALLAIGRRRRESPLESLNEMPTRHIFDSLNERPPYFS